MPKGHRGDCCKTAISHWSVLHIIRQLVSAKSLQEGDKTWHMECTTRLSVASAETAGSNDVCSCLHQLLGECYEQQVPFYFAINTGPLLCWLSITQSLHLHLTRSLVDRWGVIDDLATSSLHSSRLSAVLMAAPSVMPVHSGMLSSHLFFVCLFFSSLYCALQDYIVAQIKYVRASYRPAAG